VSGGTRPAIHLVVAGVPRLQVYSGKTLVRLK
jgi:hypothetical protein